MILSLHTQTPAKKVFGCEDEANKTLSPIVSLITDVLIGRRAQLIWTRRIPTNDHFPSDQLWIIGFNGIRQEDDGDGHNELAIE